MSQKGNVSYTVLHEKGGASQTAPQLPREKLQDKGVESLTSSELLALLLGSGSRTTPVFALARKVEQMLEAKNLQVTLSDLERLSGMGRIKAMKVLAALELAYRWHEQRRLKIDQASVVATLLHDIAIAKQEHFVTLSLNGANELIQKRVVSVGLVNRSQIHAREVFANVLQDRASAVIFAHNHPSGNLEPSQHDIKVQRRLERSADILGITVLDHVIVSQKGFYSFAEHGLVAMSSEGFDT